MTNKTKYDQAFIDTFALPATAVPGAAYSEVEGWDSIGHMQLIAALEDAFGITMETDDIIGFSSYSKGIELLGKYQVQIENA